MIQSSVIVGSSSTAAGCSAGAGAASTFFGFFAHANAGTAAQRATINNELIFISTYKIKCFVFYIRLSFVCPDEAYPAHSNSVPIRVCV